MTSIKKKSIYTNLKTLVINMISKWVNIQTLVLKYLKKKSQKKKHGVNNFESDNSHISVRKSKGKFDPYLHEKCKK